MWYHSPLEEDWIDARPIPSFPQIFNSIYKLELKVQPQHFLVETQMFTYTWVGNISAPWSILSPIGRPLDGLCCPLAKFGRSGGCRRLGGVGYYFHQTYILVTLNPRTKSDYLSSKLILSESEFKYLKPNYVIKN